MSDNYKSFKNYIHNDCGISKEYVQEEFKRLLKEAIDLKIQQYVNDNERLQILIEAEVRSKVRFILENNPNSFFNIYKGKGQVVLQEAINDFYTEVYTKLKENILDNVEITFKGSDKEWMMNIKKC